MKCSECHIENPAENKFCRECGAALLSVCSNCGNDLRSGDKFCGKCGQKVVVEAEEETTQLTIQDVKRKLAAILSADVEGYSRLMGDNEVSSI